MDFSVLVVEVECAEIRWKLRQVRCHLTIQKPAKMSVHKSPLFRLRGQVQHTLAATAIAST